MPRSCALSRACRGLESGKSNALTIVLVSKTNLKLLVIKYGLQYLWGHSSPLGLPAYFVHHLFQRASIGRGDLFQPKTKQCFHFSLFFCWRCVEYSRRLAINLYRNCFGRHSMLLTFFCRYSADRIIPDSILPVIIDPSSWY